jgi:hypothetical protein
MLLRKSRSSGRLLLLREQTFVYNYILQFITRKMLNHELDLFQYIEVQGKVDGVYRVYEKY